MTFEAGSGKILGLTEAGVVVFPNNPGKLELSMFTNFD
jgi:hypothetical protein